MTRSIKASERGQKPHYKVRVVLPGVVLHLASWTKPKLIREALTGPGFIQLYGGIDDVEADWIDDPQYGDTIGWIDWPKVRGITWRWSE
jgi:hypothetical protein